MMMDDRLLVTVEAAAQRLGLSRGTVYPLVLSGDIPSIKIGRARRIPVDEVEAWIERKLDIQAPQEPGAVHLARLRELASDA